MSAEIVPLALTTDEARRLTERIRLAARTFAESRDKVIALVGEAKAGDAHTALGYPSWTAYLTDVLGDEPLRLPRDDRKEMVALLAAEGMSTRAIAPIVGASQSTIRDDVKELSSSTQFPERPATVTSLDGRERPATRPEPVFREPPRPRNVDPHTGEILPPPEPVKPVVPRAPRTDVVTAMATVLSKTRDAAEAAERITAQHLAHRSGEAATWYRSLSEAIQPLQRLLTILQEKNQ
jgi:transposase-like protein